MPDYDAGRVFLSVVPSFRNVQRLISAEARSWGRDAGREFQDGFDREVGRSRQPIGPSPSESRRQGGEAGGEFADAFRRRIELATRALPPVKIGPAFGEVDQALRELRLDLERLSGKTIGIDLDAATAMAELDQIDRQLEELERTSPDIQVRIDAGAARSQLAAIHAQVNDLDGDDVVIDVRADTSFADASLNTFTGRLLLLGTAGASLAPAIVPAAGAAAAALAGIGAGALVGLGGVGAMAIGLFGVVDAVKALTKAESEAGREAVKAGQSRAAAAQQIAAAQRQVEGATAALVNAEANAAAAIDQAQRRIADAREDAAEAAEDGAIRVAQALGRQADAEAALRRAQEDARDAQQALIDARADAQRQLEDLAMDVETAALREQDAVLDVEEARRRLNETIADPEATDLERRRAQLSYDQSVQQLEQLRVRNRRLQEEQAEAVRLGVEGSEQVRNAHERERDSIEKVVEAFQDQVAAVEAVDQARRDAAAAVVDAQDRIVAAVRAAEEQQRQSAYAVESAQRSLIGAQAAVAAAAAGTGATASAATQDVADAMGALGPAGQTFARFIFGLRPIWQEIKTAAESALFPGLMTGIQALLPFVPQIAGVIGSLAGAMGQLFAQAGQSLAGPEWQAFFGYLASIGAPVLLQLGQALGNIALGFAQLLMAFAPLTDSFMRGFVEMTEAFVRWTSGLGESEGFQSFLGYVKDTAPLVLGLFSSLARAVLQLLRSMAPFGPVVLVIVTAIADLIAAIPPAVLSGIVIGVLGLVVAFQALGAVSSLIAGLTGIVAALGAPVVAIVAGIALLGAAVVAAYAHFEPFRQIVDQVTAAIRDGLMVAVAWLQEQFGELADYVREIWPQISEAITHYLNVVELYIQGWVAVVSWYWRTFGDEILAYARIIWATIQGVIEGAMKWIRGLIQFVLAIINGDWSGALDGLRDMASGAWQVITSIWEGALRVILLAVSTVLEGVVGFFRDLPGRIVAAVQWYVGTLVELGSWMVARILDGIVAIAEGALGLLGYFTGLPVQIVGWVGEKFEDLVGLGRQIIEKIVEGIKSAPGALIDAIGGMIPDSIGGFNLPWGDGPGRPPSGGGSTLQRVRGLLGAGTYISSTYRTPAHNRAIGGSPTSYHLDSANPAVDIAGTTAALDALYRRLVAIGGWRELLWRVPGHYDHIHVAHDGGFVSAGWPTLPGLRPDERPVIAQVGEEIRPRDHAGADGGLGELLAEVRSLGRRVEGAIREGNQQAQLRTLTGAAL